MRCWSGCGPPPSTAMTGNSMRGEPFIARLMGMGLRHPKVNILGADMAGQVEAVGKEVTVLRPGDEVFAVLKQGGFAEYVCVQEDELAPKPKDLSFEQAAAVPMAANTALLALRDEGRIQPGQKVLINGASGGVSTFAVQTARALGGEVTGVCSTRNVHLVQSIGSAKVIDYTTEDFTRTGQRYDLLLGITGSRSISACRRCLTPTGTYVFIGGPASRWLQPVGHVLSALAASPFVSQRILRADACRCTEQTEPHDTERVHRAGQDHAGCRPLLPIRGDPGGRPISGGGSCPGEGRYHGVRRRTHPPRPRRWPLASASMPRPTTGPPTLDASGLAPRCSPGDFNLADSGLVEILVDRDEVTCGKVRGEPADREQVRIGLVQIEQSHGHEKVPGYGQLMSPLVATKVPVFGHEKSPPLTEASTDEAPWPVTVAVLTNRRTDQGTSQ